MRRTLTPLAAAALLLLGLGAVLAHASIGTHLRVLGYIQNSDDTDDVFTGDLNSSRSKCLRDRRVKMFKATDSGFRLVDTDLSSRHGAWATRGNLRGRPDLKFTVSRTRYKQRGIVCRRDIVYFP